MSKKTPPKNLAHIDDIIERSMAYWNVPGTAIAITNGKEVLHAKGYGLRDIDAQKRVTKKTMFPICSITKSFTAMGAALLVDEGKLRWDDPVKKHLPWFKLKDDYATQHITVRDILCHRTGLPRHDLMWVQSGFSRKEILQRLEHLEASKGFRESWQYQNIMYCLAGYLVAELAGTDWESFSKERILKPLELQNTVLTVSDFEKRKNHVKTYQKLEDGFKVIPYNDLSNIAPAGAIHADVIDMTTWLRLHINKGKIARKRFVSEETMQEMHTPQMLAPLTAYEKEVTNVAISAYGFGWRIQPFRGQTVIMHGGGLPGISTLASFLPDEKLGLVILTNDSGNLFRLALQHQLCAFLLGYDDTAWDIKHRDYANNLKQNAEKRRTESKASQKKSAEPSHGHKDFVGIYEHAAYPSIEVRKKKKGGLEVKIAGEFWNLHHYHYDVFEVILGDTEGAWRGKINFQTNNAGNIASLSFQPEPLIDPLIYKRIVKKEKKTGKKAK